MRQPQKAYKNKKFLSSRAARPLRILAEFIEPESRFKKHKIKNSIVFYGSARIKPEEKLREEISRLKKDGEKNIKRMAVLEKQLNYCRYYDDSYQLAKKLTEWSNHKWPGQHEFPIMTGGGPGVMEAANRGAGSVPHSVNIGLSISLPFERNSNPYITEELNFEFHYFFSRKFWFMNMASVLVVFPGGFGTLDELFELLTLVQTGKVKKKPAILLYGKEYWDRLIDFRFLAENGFIDEEDMNLFRKCDDVEGAFNFLSEFLSSLKRTQ
jgi:uncharacterized protein (TIGR00730 family)